MIYTYFLFETIPKKLPEEVLEDREKLLEWIQKSLEVKKK